MRPNAEVVRQAAHALAAAPSRGQILARWGLTFDEVKEEGLGLYNGALSIPFRGQDGTLLGAKLRNLGAGHEDPDRFRWLDTGRAPGIYLAQGANDGPVVVLLEGPLKALAARPFIQRPCAALASGAAVGIPGEAREMFREKHVLYLADNDPEGLRVAGLLRSQLRGIAASLRAVAFPQKELVVPGKVKDINDLLAEWRRAEPDGGAQKIERAGDWILNALADAPDLLARGNEKGGAPAQAEQDEGAGAGPIINAGDQDLTRVSAKAWRALLAANDPPMIFRRGGVMANIARADDGRPVIENVSESRLRHVLARIARWHRKQEPALPPMHVIRDMMARPNLPLPILTRIVAAPVFSSDGTLHQVPGYNLTTRVYFDAAGFAVPPVPERPAEEDLRRARDLILSDLLGDFPFVGDAERAHAAALLLLPFVREMIVGPTPLHLIEKPSPGTGATLLADVLLFPATGRRLPFMAEGRDEDEWRKRITSALLAGHPAVVLDNIRRRLEAGALSSAITADEWEDRVLGRSEMIRVASRCAWVATGNNVALSDEIARRTVRIRLDARVDRPWLRNGFRHQDLRGWAASHRGELVWASLTMVRAWLAAGKPEGKGTLGMFDGWARTLGGILMMAGVPGFLANLAELYDEADSVGAAWRSLAATWWEKVGAQEVGVADLWLLAAPTDREPMDLGLGEGTERALKTRFGKALARMRDRQFGDFRIVRGGVHHSAQQWRLVSARPGGGPEG